MPSRSVRLTCCAAAWIALGGAAFFVFQSEKQIAVRASAVRAFDVHAREAASALGDVRAAQQAYVAAGQDNAFWMPKVTSTTDQVTAAVGSLREAAMSANARASLDQAANTVAMFAEIDKRAREYLKSDQPLMAADVIFTEGGEAAGTAARSIEGARLAERQGADAADAADRMREAMAIGGAAGFAALIVLLLVPAGTTVRLKADTTDETGEAVSAHATSDRRGADKLLDLDEWASPARPAPTAASARPASPARPAARSAPPALPVPPALSAPPSLDAPPVLEALPDPPALPAPPGLVGPHPAQGLMKAAADLATDFGRVSDLDDLSGILGRAAEAMDATGLVVWMGNLTGGDLRPLLAHGYNEQTLSRMTPVARTDTNAAAAAYRSGHLQIVVSTPESSGALVAPILVPGGCIGALSAEFRGGETSDSVQSFATIVAAHLATVLTMTPAESIEPKAAQA